jgi:uncharacterized membrane protein
MVILFLGVVVVSIWLLAVASKLSSLETRVGMLERKTDSAPLELSVIHTLTARIAALEGRARAESAPAASPVRSDPATAPPIAVRPPVVVAPPIVAPRPVFAPSAMEPPPVPMPAAPDTTTAEAPIAAPDDAWEVTVGGSWLNKIGVLVFVIGLALLVGYSVSRVGPAARIGIGMVVSLTMLGGGVVMERRGEYRTYGYGLIAGGWAGLYFTTYAARAVEAARIFDSDLIAIVCLLAVAAGMVWHAMRYRSQEVTSLALVVAFATLALTPLAWFALVASVPLAAGTLLVAQRLNWPRVQVLGIVCTYGLYVLRGQVFGFGDLDPATLTPYAALATYWLIFEVADLAALRRPKDESAPPAPLFLLNAAGVVGAGLMQLPTDTPVPLSTFLLCAGAAYLASAVARARLVGRSPSDEAALTEAGNGSYQGASAFAAMLVVVAIELRLEGPRSTLALLMQAELLFLSGLLLRDWLIRGVGSAVAIVAGVHAIGGGTVPEVATPVWSWAAQGPAAAAALTAVLWFANRELLRARRVPLLWHEWAYTPVATYLVVLVASLNLSAGYSALAVLGFALVLLEAGLRLGREYRYQSYVVGSISAVVLLSWFLGRGVYDQAPTTRDAWVMLTLSAMITWIAAWRLAPGRALPGESRGERVVAAAITGSIGTACLVVLQWVVIAPEYVGMAWAITAAAIGGAGLWRRTSGLRWQAYPLLGLALVRTMLPILESGAQTPLAIVSALLVIGLLYAGSLAVRGAIAHAGKNLAEIEDAARMALSVVATVALGVLIYREVRPTLVTVTWGLQAAALMGAGFPARERLLRLSGLAVLLACLVRLFIFDLPQLEELARIISFVALGAVLLAVSWIYTRYRSRIQKYL